MGLVIALIAGLVFLIALAFGLTGLVVFLFNLQPPRWLSTILWALPAAPFIMASSFVIFAFTVAL